MMLLVNWKKCIRLNAFQTYLILLVLAFTNPTVSYCQQTSLWGLTFVGGDNDGGVIFKYDNQNNIYSKKADFNYVNGFYPNASLMQANDGKLYGLTQGGGDYGAGVLFKFDPVTNDITKKVDLDNINGSSPGGTTLIQASDGKLYGMTYYGGINNEGVIFQYDISTGTYTKKIDLSQVTGSHPNGSLIQANDGKLYGMTYDGGINNAGVIFQYDIATGTYTKKVDLSMLTGAFPVSDLIQASNGRLYGMTDQGGLNNVGVIFEYDLVNNILTKKIDLGGPNRGFYPGGVLVEASDGKLYGLTRFGSQGSGSIFQYDYNTNTFTTKIDFATVDEGFSPYGSLIQAGDGLLYGMTALGGLNIGSPSMGGSNGAGVIFSYDPLTNSYAKKIDLSISNGANPIYTNLLEVDNCFGTVTIGADEHLYFGYTPQQCKTIPAVTTGAVAPLSYSWSLDRALAPGETFTGTSTNAATVCLLDTAMLCVTVNDVNGCTYTDCTNIFAEDVRCNSNSSNPKVSICHNGQVVCVAQNAVNAHLAHGDNIGQCPSLMANPGGGEIVEIVKSGINIYPNPTSGGFLVDLTSLPNKFKGGLIQIVNMNGQVIKRVDLFDKTKVDIRLDKPGVYLVLLLKEGEIITQRKIVVR